jgi:hypothetical protein
MGHEVQNVEQFSYNTTCLKSTISLTTHILNTRYTTVDLNTSSFSTPFALRALGGGLPRLPLFLRITTYSRQVISLALEACYLGQLDSNIYIPSGARVAQLYPQALGAHFSRLLRHA